jgi:7-cyano-7-deazaguanine synthase
MPNLWGLLLSGGLDSSILLTHLLSQGESVQPIYVRSQLAWETAELAAVRQFLATAARSRPAGALRELVVLEMPLADVYGAHWSVTGQAVPDQATPDEAMYLPGRNACLLIKPVLYCQQHGIGRLALASLATNPFADATDEFFDQLMGALNRGVRTPVDLRLPFGAMEKSAVMRLATECPLEKTFSCVDPVGSLHCGRCNKCAERRAAFLDAGMADPTRYASPQESSAPARRAS